MPLNSPAKFESPNNLIAAGGTLDALTGWQYETPDVDCMIEVIERATATGLVSEVTSAGASIKQSGGVQAGGTAGVTPARLNSEPVTGKAPKNQKLRVFVRNPTAGGITYDLLVVLTPLSGGRTQTFRARSRPTFRRRRR